MAITTQTLITGLVIIAACIIGLPAVLFAIKSIRDTKQINKEQWPSRYGIDPEEFARQLRNAGNRLNTKTKRSKIAACSGRQKMGSNCF